MQAIADSGFIAALFARSVPREQRWAMEMMRRAQLPIPTTILVSIRAAAP